MEPASSERFSIRSTDAKDAAAPDGAELRTAFSAGSEYSVGIEDEVMLVAPDTLELVASGPEVLERLSGDDRFKLELPASQLEIVMPPAAAAGELAAPLLDARRALAVAADGIALPVAVSVHPFSAGLGVLNDAGQYEYTIVDMPRSPVASSCARCTCMSASATRTAPWRSTTWRAHTCRCSPR